MWFTAAGQPLPCWAPVIASWSSGENRDGGLNDDAEDGVDDASGISDGELGFRVAGVNAISENADRHDDGHDSEDGN